MREKKEGSIRAALNRNVRFGFVAGGLDDRGLFADLYDTDQVQYSPGLTAIATESHTRESLFAALKARSCYATTGARIIIGFQIAGEVMGSELSTHEKPGLAYNRHITGHVVGDAPMKEVELFRNGTRLALLTLEDDAFTFDDDELIDQTTLQSPDDRPPFIYYYLRAVQQDGHIAWSSPIWIDHPAGDGPQKKGKKR
jgi:hypothetical protein